MLDKMLAIQKKYNDDIRATAEYGNFTDEEWAQTYLLGLISEIDEVLAELNWKKHRKTFTTPDRTNLGFELTDLLKYVLSLWELWGYTSSDIYAFFHEKSEALTLQRKQEQEDIPIDRPLLITDLDGTLADWRVAFVSWIRDHGIDPVEDREHTMLIDQDLRMDYPTYYRLKEKFESEGGYRDIPIYPDVVPFLLKLQKEHNPYIIAITARPNERYSRIWLDTWGWITDHGLHVDKLLIGSTKRILLATTVSCPVLLLEDDPALLMRGGSTGKNILARKHPYNNEIKFPNINFFNDLSEVDVKSLFKE